MKRPSWVLFGVLRDQRGVGGGGDKRDGANQVRRKHKRRHPLYSIAQRYLVVPSRRVACSCFSSHRMRPKVQMLSSRGARGGVEREREKPHAPGTSTPHAFGSPEGSPRQSSAARLSPSHDHNLLHFTHSHRKDYIITICGVSTAKHRLQLVAPPRWPAGSQSLPAALADIPEQPTRSLLRHASKARMREGQRSQTLITSHSRHGAQMSRTHPLLECLEW